MSQVIALVPARKGSRGIAGKNFRPFAGGLSCADLALLCARRADIPAISIFLSTDYEYPPEPPHEEIAFRIIKRPAELATDTASMLSVVQHAMQEIPGDDSDIWVLLQPTAVFRTPDHIRQAIALLRETQADSVVSVVELPRTQHPNMLCEIEHGKLWPIACDWAYMPTCRQNIYTPAVKRDGTVYAFFRRTVTEHRTIYGRDVRPLIIPPEQSCELDTEADWREVECRWKKERT